MDLRKIYGIEFDESLPCGGERRILDAKNLCNDYVVGTVFQKNGGKNDFDSAYPFGAIRLCCVKLDNGKKVVTYEGEPGFSRTGSSGNVMVEIPKFYSRREKEGNTERWMVSGTCHEGFAIEPCFLRSGEELPCIYVGVYNSHEYGNGVFSATGDLPDVRHTIEYFEKTYSQQGYDPYDFSVMLCLQRLCIIELGTRNFKSVLGGICMMQYFSRVTPQNAIVDIGPNRVSVLPTNRNLNFAPGHEVGFGHIAGNCDTHRTVTHVARNPQQSDWIDIFYSGDDLSGQLTPGGDSVYGMPQKNGQTDSLPYHTGRCDMQAPFAPELNALLSPFRYRGIENLWGNVWEFVSGLRMHKLHYYYTFDPDLYGGSRELWNQYLLTAPEQHLLPDHDPDGPHWVSSLGMDDQNPLVPLPVKIASGELGMYYDAVLNAYKDRNYDNQPIDPDREYSTATGGAWDHKFASPFLYRCFMSRTSCNWLYSNRLCLRK